MSHYETICDGTGTPYQAWPGDTEGLDLATEQARILSISSPHGWTVRAVPGDTEPYVICRYACGRLTATSSPAGT